MLAVLAPSFLPSISVKKREKTSEATGEGGTAAAEEEGYKHACTTDRGEGMKGGRHATFRLSAVCGMKCKELGETRETLADTETTEPSLLLSVSIYCGKSCVSPRI